MLWRVAAAALALAVVSYGLWVAAAADDYGSPSVWTILTATVFFLAVAVLLAVIVRGVVNLARSRRH